MQTHRLDASPETVHWGYFDASLKPLITVDPGDVVVMSTVSGGPWPTAASRFGPYGAAGAAGDSQERAAEAEWASHHDRAGRGARRQGRAGA